MASDHLKKGAWIGTVCLGILVFQHTLFFYATHEGRVPDKNGNLYFAPTMVVFVEVFKAVISFVILWIQQYRKLDRGTSSASYTLLNDMSGRDADQEEKSLDERVPHHGSRIAATWDVVHDLIFAKTALKLAIPATLYVVQTITAIIGAQNLDSTSFIIASQLKFATTALCTSFMLNRVIGVKRWYSIGALSIGVLMVQLQSNKGSSHISDARNPILGLSAIVVACFISGFAAIFVEKILKNAQRFALPFLRIFVEKILKNGKANLWATNIQLGSFGLIPALLPVLADAWRSGLHHPFLYFGLWAWTTVIANVMGGLVVALVMKYADNIQKSMAISVSIILTFFITVAVGKAEMKPMAMLGASVVIGSILVYSRSAPPPVLVSEPTSPEMIKEATLSQVTVQKPLSH